MNSYRQFWSLETDSRLDAQGMKSYRMDTADSGPRLMMIHGLEEEWHVWHQVCLQLQAEARPYCLEMPWCGQNGHRWGQFRQAAGWLREALSPLPFTPDVLVGHSLGANAILEYFLQQNPPEVKALILVSPFYRGQEKDFTWTFFDRSKEIFYAIMLESFQVRMGQREIESGLLTDMVNKVYEMIGPVGYMEFLSLFMRTPSLPLHQINVPVLVLGGAGDIGSTPESNEVLVRSLPQAHLKIIEDSGHFTMLTHAAEMAAAIHRFLQKYVRRGETQILTSPLNLEGISK